MNDTATEALPRSPALSPYGRLAPAAATMFAVTALIVVFWGLFQLDVPVARFMRSVHLPWLELFGDMAHRLGSGPSLLLMSGSLFAAGWLWQRASWRQAGLEGVLAHGLVAIAVQSLKHLIGRPRPRFMHGHDLAMGPSWDSGLDSFPSGHTSASFAVAVVLAHHFPRARWGFYGAAAMVGASRVLRGSHFPSDVAAGVALGVLAGMIVVHPLSEWRRTLSRSLVWISIGLVTGFGLLWAALRLPSSTDSMWVMLATGGAVIAAGLLLRLQRWRRGSADRSAFMLGHDVGLIAVGLALITGSALVATVTLFAATAYGFQRLSDPVAQPSSTVSLQTEMSFLVAVALAVIAIHAIRGILPLL